MDDALDRGDLLACLDPSWTEKWSQWSPGQVQRYIADAAAFGPLTWDQSVAILQGLPPQPKGWPGTSTVLAEYASVVDRLRKDMERGAVSSTPTPEELAAWCDSMAHSLPAPFVDELRARARSTSARTSFAPQSTTPIVLPAWAPLPVATGPVRFPVPKRGRPRTAAPTYAAVRAAAAKILMDAAWGGATLSLAALAQQLEGAPAAGSMSRVTILRRLKGELPVQKAKSVAARVRATKST